MCIRVKPSVKKNLDRVLFLLNFTYFVRYFIINYLFNSIFIPKRKCYNGALIVFSYFVVLKLEFVNFTRIRDISLFFQNELWSYCVLSFKILILISWNLLISTTDVIYANFHSFRLTFWLFAETKASADLTLTVLL